MPFDRLVARTMSRLARGGFAGLRQPDPALAGDMHAATAPHGSGSWANEWTGAGPAVARAKSLALPGRSRTAQKAGPGPIAEGAVRTKPLMSLRGVKLHNWIADRMEAEAPTCSLHSGVALGAFLTAAPVHQKPAHQKPAHQTNDPLRGLVADMLIADENGQPVAALILQSTADPSRRLKLLDALLDADLPVVDIPNRPSLADLWAEISKVLPKD